MTTTGAQGRKPPMRNWSNISLRLLPYATSPSDDHADTRQIACCLAPSAMLHHSRTSASHYVLEVSPRQSCQLSGSCAKPTKTRLLQNACLARWDSLPWQRCLYKTKGGFVASAGQLPPEPHGSPAITCCLTYCRLCPERITGESSRFRCNLQYF